MNANRLAQAALPFLLAVAVAGCTQFRAVTDERHQREVVEQFSSVDHHSSFPALSRASFEQVNLVELIDPSGEAREKFQSHWPREEEKWGIKYDLTLAWFRESPVEPELKRQHRNGVQDKILAVSTSRCNVFKTYLRRQQTDVNFLLGSASTISGVLGAVLQGVNSSRNLAGAAGLFSGLRAEYNQSYYSSLAAHVIVQGIELHRSRLTKELMERRARLGISEYSMEAAIKDAVYIDGMCSTVTGLIEAQESIKEIQDPGLTIASQAILRARAMQELSQTDLKTLESSGRLDALKKLLSPAISPLVASTVSDAAAQATASLGQSRDAGLRVAAAIAREAENLGRDYERAREKLAADKRGTVTGGAVQQKFSASATTRIYDVLTATRDGKKGVLTDCISKMEVPAGKAGEANALLLLAANDGGQAIKARLEADKAQAELRAAISRIERVVGAANAALGAAGTAGRGKFDKLTDLTKFDPASVEIGAAMATDGLACP